MEMLRNASLLSSLRWFALAVALCAGPSARAASITLDIAAVPNGNIDFAGAGAGNGASFSFTNDFTITETTGNHSSVGFLGTIGGTFTYTTVTPTVTPAGVLDTAVATASNGSLSISDGTTSLTGTVSSMNISTLGAGGTINYSGSIDLSGISYTGSNIELLALKNDVDMNSAGGILTVTFQFTNPSQTLTSLEIGNNSTSYSGTISASGEFNGQTVPEPGSLCLGCIALGTVVLGTSWRRFRRG
jgi:hypothetical protein